MVNTGLAEANTDKIVAFLKAVDQVNGMYLADPAAWTADSAEVKALAAATGADPAQVPGILEGFTFLPMADQISDDLAGRRRAERSRPRPISCKARAGSTRRWTTTRPS